MPEEAGGQEKAHRIVSVPPLHHGVHGAGVDGIALGQRDGQRQAVEDVQYGDADDQRAEEPVRDVNVLDRPLGDGAEEHDSEGDPDQRDEDIDGPFQFCVFLGGGQAQGQRDGCQHDDRLPAPEHELSQAVGNQRRLAGSLNHIEGAGHEGASAEREDHGVGVQGAEAAE